MKKITALILSVCIVSAGFISSAFNNSLDVYALPIGIDDEATSDEQQLWNHGTAKKTFGMVEINGTWRRQTTYSISFEQKVTGTLVVAFSQSNLSARTKWENFHVYIYGAGLYGATENAQRGYFYVEVTDCDYLVIVAQNTTVYNSGTGESYMNFHIPSEYTDLALGWSGSDWWDIFDERHVLIQNYFNDLISSSGSGGSGSDFEYDYSDEIDELVSKSTYISNLLEMIDDDTNSIDAKLQNINEYIIDIGDNLNSHFTYDDIDDIKSYLYSLYMEYASTGNANNYINQILNYLSQIANGSDSTDLNAEVTNVNNNLVDLNLDMNNIDNSYQSYNVTFNNSMQNVNQTITDINTDLQTLRVKSNLFYDIFLNSSLNVLIQDYRLSLLVFLPVLIVVFNFFLGRRH